MARCEPRPADPEQTRVHSDTCAVIRVHIDTWHVCSDTRIVGVIIWNDISTLHDTAAVSTGRTSDQPQFTLLQNIFLEPPICSNTAHWLLEMTTKFREFSRLINIHNRTLLGQYDLLTILLIISCIWRQASQFQVYFLGPSGNIILWNFHEILLPALVTADHTRVTCHVSRVTCPH